MDGFGWIIGVIIVIFVGLMIVVVHQEIDPDSSLNQRRKMCADKGGVWKQPYKSAAICIRKDAIIEIN